MSTESHDAKEEIEKSQKTKSKPKIEKPVKVEKVEAKQADSFKPGSKEKSGKISRRRSNLLDSHNVKKYNIFESIAVDEASGEYYWKI